MEVLQADGAVKYLLHYAESDLIIVITESMVIGQFAIGYDLINQKEIFKKKSEGYFSSYVS